MSGEQGIGAMIHYPIDPYFLIRKKKSMRRALLQRPDLTEKRIAILGGSTTAEVKDMMELFLLSGGIRPVFYESEYNRYSEDILFPNPALERFSPDVIYIHTSSVNITRFPAIRESEADVQALLDAETGRFQALWDKISKQYGCSVIQNNFELPHFRGMGNLDGYDIHGRTRFIAELNHSFSRLARERRNLYLNDIHYLSAWFGLERWYDKLYWYSYKYAMSCEAIPFLANSVASIIKALFGKSRKCLVLDLDNTLWGGVIGDDGLKGLQLGPETPEGEAYTEFQKYVRELKERGIILAVCSKNEEANAREGFSHPDSILKPEDFSAFCANWDPKPGNICDVAKALGIGLDSLVFADDDPAERDLVRSQQPQVAVPELGNNVAAYISLLDKTGLFETVSISPEDLERNTFYAQNAARQELEEKYPDYHAFLRSLQMNAEIRAFVPVYWDRIAQLINKTNQFNVTTRRYTQAEIEAIAGQEKYLTLYGRLRDKFGEHGLIAAIIGEIRGTELHIDLWLMSCRVLKRGMEEAMFDQLVEAARAVGITVIHGYYSPTARNGLVSGLFEHMGFACTERNDAGETKWRWDMPQEYRRKNLFIEVNG